MSKLIIGKNDLATLHPELAKEWHPTRNGNLTPETVLPGSNKKVWWLLPYDDPITGKHFDFEWEANVNTRVSGIGCPYLSGRKIMEGFNDLQTINPELAKEWHPSKNFPLTPQNVGKALAKKVWWLGNCGHEWECTIQNRFLRGDNCPICSGHKIKVGYNDLATTHPEIAKEWHPTRNGNLTPEAISPGNTKKVWWLLPYDDPITGKHYDFEWEASISNRCRRGDGCPYISNKKAWKGYNDLASTHPNLAREWHPTKNGDLKPTDVLAGTNKKVWWYFPYDDPITGKHFDFEWEATINNRAINGSGCPILSGFVVWKGYNDLATTHPDLAKEWHPEKNGNLTPDKVTKGDRKTVWWLLPYDDPVTGKHFDFEWKASIQQRVRGTGCPFLTDYGAKVCSGFNDLATLYPQIASMWHPTKNGKLTPNDVTPHSGIKVWWLLPYDDEKTGKHFDFEWQSIINVLVNANGACPYLAENNARLVKGFNDLESVRPDLAALWSSENNISPSEILAYSSQKVKWVCEKGHTFNNVINNMTRNGGCPYCNNKKLLKGFNDLATVRPDLLKEWDYSKNKIAPDSIIYGSNTLVYWTCDKGHPSYRSSPGKRISGTGCPYCAHQKIDPKTNSFGATYPELLKEWDYDKNKVDPFNIFPNHKHKVWWICEKGHEWQTYINSRIRKAGHYSKCPVCTGSKGEYYLSEILSEQKILFVSEKVFDEQGFHWYSYDCYIPEKEMCIEIDGIQHFRDDIIFFEESTPFKKRCKNDNAKNSFCLNNNIKLLRIPYIDIYDDDEIKDYILKYILSFLENGIIPQNIIEFYAKFEFSNYAETAQKMNQF